MKFRAAPDETTLDPVSRFHPLDNRQQAAASYYSDEHLSDEPLEDKAAGSPRSPLRGPDSRSEAEGPPKGLARPRSDSAPKGAPSCCLTFG
jgi:hypothetical protein